MIQQRIKPTLLRKLYPNTKLWMSLALTIAVILFANTWFSLAIMVISVMLIFTEKYYLEFKIVAFAILTMALSMFLINGTLNPINDFTKNPVYILPILNWKFYEEGLTYALEVFRRVAPLMAALFLLFRTMNMTDLGVAMNQGGLPYKASFIFITTFQILPVLSKEMSQIMDAQKARGLDVEGSLWKRIKAFIPIMVPVVANSIMKVQNQAIALETRGFNSTSSKTIYRDLAKSPIDKVLMVSSILLILVAIIYRIIIVFI